MATTLLYILVFLLRLSYRFKVLNPDVLEKARKASVGGNYIFAIWHRNILSYMAFCYGKPHVNLASRSRDGALVADVLEKIGHRTVRGSSSKGGGRAVISLVRLLKKGYSGTVAVDGPRGPREVPKQGIFLLAKMSGVPIVPLSFNPRFYRCFEKSWDGFRFPVPFSRIDVFFGEPIVVEVEQPRREFERLGEQLQRALRE